MNIIILFVGTELMQMILTVPIFVSIFMRLLKKTYSTIDAVVIESYELREGLAYCKSCQKTYIRHFTQLNELSDAYFLEVRKFLIQYYPSSIADNYFVIVNIHNDG